MTVGTGRHIWNPGVLSISGSGAPLASQIISATLTYGALGTCQGGTIKTARLPAVGARDNLWQVGMDGEGVVFAGVVDQATQAGGELADVPLLAPHRVTLEGLGETVGAPYNLRQFGVYAPYTQAHERLLDVVTRVLDPSPTADYGVGPELVAAIGVPEQATPQVYTLDSNVLSIRSLGYGIPDYTTDALFDPGDGWQKYVYRRGGVPPYALRKTGQATAEQATVTQTTDLGWNYVAVGQNEYAAAYPANTIYADGGNREYRGPLDLATTSPSFDVGRYWAVLGSNTPTRRARKLTIICPFTVTGLDKIAADKGATSPVLTIRLTHASGAVGAYTQALAASHVGLSLAANFEVPADLLSGGGEFRVDYQLGNFASNYSVHLAVQPIRSVLEVETPNTGNVVMPDGWYAPFAVGPVFELRLRGWHIPPFRIRGLPGGLEQMAAGATVTYNRQEVTTTITTMAWPYAGQRRGSR